MLAQRILTGAVLGALVVATVLWLPPIAAGLVLGALWLLGVREWAGFARLGASTTIAYVLAAAVLMLVASRLVSERAVTYAVLAIAILWWLVALTALHRYPRAISRGSTAAAGFAALLPAWALLAVLHTQPEQGRWWILTLLAIVWSADVGAYGVGRAIGRTKLAPRVSPGKTWEGVAGGLLCASLTGWLASRFLGIEALELGLLAAATAAVSVVGDLTVSLFKRNAGLKDSGRLLPGHGGVLDRIDSLTAATSVFVLGLAAAGIIT